MSTNPVVVIGAGPAGLEAARGVADLGTQVVLVEKAEVLGGMPIAANYAALTPDMRPGKEAMAEMTKAVEDSDLIDVKLNSTIIAAKGDAPALTLTIKDGDGESEITAGSVIIATGFEHFDPGKENQVYGYYEYDDVITLADAEGMLSGGDIKRPSNGEAPKRICFVQCVGSRDRQIGNQWCSKVCCGIASKQAIEFREKLPDTQVFVFYIDLRAYGFWEDELYWKAQEEHKVNFIRGIITEVTKRGDRLLVKGEDTTMGRPLEVEMDMVVLSVGMEPSEGTKAMRETFDLPAEHKGWIATTGGALNTTSTTKEGVFVAGAAMGPSDLEDSVSTGGAAAMKAASFVRKAASAAA